MNDRSPSGPSAAPIDTSYDASFPGYPGHEGFEGAYSMAQEQPYVPGVGYANDTSYVDDPLFGTMPGQGDISTAPAAPTASYAPYDPYAPYAATGTPESGYQHTGGYDNLGFESNTPWDSGSYPAASIPTQPDHQWAADATGTMDTSSMGMVDTGQWDLGPQQSQQQPQYDQYGGGYDSYHAYDGYGSYDGYGGYGGEHDAFHAAPDHGAPDQMIPGQMVPDQPVPGAEHSAYPHVGQHTYDYNGSWDTGSYRLDTSATSTTTSGTGALDDSAWNTGGWTVASLDQLNGGQLDGGQGHSGYSGQPGMGEPQDSLGDTTDFGPDLAARLHGDVHSEAHGDVHSDVPQGDALRGEAAHDDAGSEVDSDFYADDLDDLGSDDLHGASDVPPTAPLAGGRGRRRAAKPRRSALLTVAVPSVAVMGVAGIAAASVGVVGEEEEKGSQAAPDPTSVKPSNANSKLDTQLEGVSEDAGAFAGRASRAQERIDLKERQEAERKRKEAEAARKEAERPKFALPVDQPGLSAYYGQAGINWMSLHTGIDFPVSYGAPVKAATDGIVSTKYDLSYGNMVIVTAADGTETWYCHMSSAKIRGGEVKAGDTIGYSGNSGNSTGPHLHFEVRPGGGSAVDPLAWFRGKGLDPT